ncbi:hypothetical protein EAY25_21320 [Escherichia coli]|uniref:Uncharacterized protein n=1 Tax=Escherichia coli TaxID=562 RepID=A0A2P1H271_ECOLX|nr:hypothetical protein CDC27_27230 [Escherichia coli]AVN57434.1 hypothetical protein [Escherichia coli]EEW3184004.1 hypothetical protein [Escherichia coli]EFB2339610.1 hypothetical protein [Escherichia coli]MDN1459210.1 hypothetical protein [Escherichia coli]
MFLTCISGAGAAYVYKGLWSTNQHNQIFLRTISFSVSGSTIGLSTSVFDWHCCKVSDEAAFCLIQRPYISKTLLTRRISPRGSP